MDVALNVSSLDFTSGLVEHLRGGHVIWAYAVLAATTAPPLVPNAVLLVTGGVMAAEGRLDLALVLLVVAGSAVLGDMLIHRLGRALSGRVLARMRRRPRQAALLKWAALRIQRHGVPFVIGIRFLPSGRVIGGLAAGVVRYPARRYAAGAGVAEVVWASYSVGAGYVSGRAASNSFYALTLGLGISLVVAGIGTVAQWISRSRDRRRTVAAGEIARPSAVVATSLAGESGATVSVADGGVPSSDPRKSADSHDCPLMGGK
ncbi:MULTISPECIES: DedA family protein [unclassified Streptomyces]|uniref:DedA family protein n=1 Tax=unclassified Streptomyces TaxID=2593676 RepID=UPI002E2B5036|nr:VTT domain-containing protein [Streptomyces sp. NBC_00223]